MRLKQYASYKDSSSAWLGIVPEHWEFTRNKFVIDITKGRNPEELSDDWEDGLIPYLSMDYLRGQADPKYVLSEQVFCEVQTGEILLLWDGANAGEFIDAKSGALSSTLALLKLKKNVSINYYRYYCKAVESEVRRSSVGMGIPHVNGDELKSLVFPEPSIEEQTDIAKFLNRETSKLDTLISKQEKLIGLLQEKRQAIISHAVTKGLNPDAKMKDSGVEWFKSMPESWDVASIKWFTKIYSGGTPDKSNDSYWENGTVPWLNSGSVNADIITLPSDYITEEAFKNSSAKWIPKDSLVIALAGQGKTKGMVAQLAIDTSCNQSMAAIIPTSKITSRFLFWWLKANYQNIRNLAGGDLRDGLNLEMIGGIYAPLPSFLEQVDITNFLDNETLKIDTLIDKAKRSIELAKEHRTALISAAVTGKIDVRDPA